MGQILRVTKAFSVLSDPNGHIYTPGELVEADHPHVKGREHHFETVEAHVSARSGRETATAAPGEKRSRTPRKRTAKKANAKKAAAPRATTAKKAASAPSEPATPPAGDSPAPSGD